VRTAGKVIKPVSSEIIAHRIPNAKLLRIGGGSHFLFLSLEMRKVFNREALNFLESDAPSIN